MIISDFDNTFDNSFGDFPDNFIVSILKSYKVALSSSLQLGWISNQNVDDFFYFFSGGETGVKGYTFYEESLTGASQVIVTNIIRFPIFTEKNYVFLNFSMQNFIVGFVGQIGGAPSNINHLVDIEEYRLSSGFEARINGFSFYSYPTAIEYSCHVPVLDESNHNLKQYLKVLFNF